MACLAEIICSFFACLSVSEACTTERTPFFEGDFDSFVYVEELCVRL